MQVLWLPLSLHSHVQKTIGKQVHTCLSSPMLQSGRGMHMSQAVTAALSFLDKGFICPWSYASIFNVCDSLTPSALVAACILGSAVG